MLYINLNKLSKALNLIFNTASDCAGRNFDMTRGRYNRIASNEDNFRLWDHVFEELKEGALTDAQVSRG